ncbi:MULTISPECIES: hypothetical protein [Clostridium]|uniref:DUF11 domain-containing protein n=2 Tax=Clostridium TaxID=1485 RepID=D8GM99_CLOLD|nr:MULTISPECIES: hypothetical protein [Clostridium]ADK13509.1 hypothetical protein CLJU_c04270 [Clostridium ljungdahlii DSM 13528]AGY76704.1 hypothetical protein CAETHG_2495 [Clostridium autoethanogenum DSM 10061]ALU36859.1 hypothetical protein CLAU_2431 [Clostridium autoethanogenum DSM 10061]OAA89127.1 hypothetical protein WX45_02368 [Clostridium ljungdahlii DSM 13528]OVY50451.1 hypothetical protein WX72_02523 [Clostridium autoethanogenum]
MADQVQPCSCTSYTNICCCGAQNGISVVQPQCQTLSDGRVVNNPAYDPLLTKSFWTYKFITDCNKDTRSISNFVIPICQSISSQSVEVFEKIDGCGQFQSINFTLSLTDPNFGNAPSGFQWLKIEVSERYQKGVSVEYRIELVGNFPTDTQPIKIKAANNILTFDCDCLLLPKCNDQGVLSVIKTCNHTITNNQVTLNYTVNVTNTGNAALNNVQYLDTVFISSALVLGTITVNPSTLSINTTVLGEVIISGNLGTISPGDTIPVTYTIPITSITVPRTYTVNNTVRASATGTESTDTCSTEFSAVELGVVKCCNINENSASFTVTISSIDLSPNTTVNVIDNFFIPSGITLQFNDFGGFTAKFTSSEESVPLSTNIVGPINITLSDNNLQIPAGGSINRTVRFTVISSSLFGTATIENTVNSIVLSEPNSQVFLGAGHLPVKSDIDITLNLTCRQPCS